jgi:uncharacterized membrane protein
MKKNHSHKYTHHDIDCINKLIEEENQHIRHLNTIVLESLNEKESLVRQVSYEMQDRKLTFGMKIADRVAAFGGSWNFILSFAFIVGAWMVINNFMGSSAFDPFPYILLNLVLSCLAAFQAPVILMSQNREVERERKRSENEYIINLKAELQTRELNSKIDVLVLDQMKVLIDTQKLQIQSLTKIEKKLDKLYKQVNQKVDK